MENEPDQNVVCLLSVKYVVPLMAVTLKPRAELFGAPAHAGKVSEKVKEVPEARMIAVGLSTSEFPFGIIVDRKKLASRQRRKPVLSHGARRSAGAPRPKYRPYCPDKRYCSRGD